VATDRAAGPGSWEAIPAAAAAVVAAAPSPILALDLNLRVRLVNPATERLIGRPGAEVIGCSVAELLPPDAAAAGLDRIGTAARGGTGELELEVAHPTLGRIPIGLSVAPLRVDGRRIGAVAVGHERTGRTQLERELADLAAGFQVLSEASDLAVYRLSFDPEVRFLAVNRAFETGTGWPLERLVADPRGFAAILPPGVARRLVTNRTRPTEATWPVEFEWTHHPDGDRRWLSVHEVVVPGADGQPGSVLGMVRDVTRQRRQEAALADALRLERAAAAELRRIDDLRRLFLQAASHELRTPLTSVLGFASTLRDRHHELDEHQIRQLADRVHVQGRKLQRLLDDLLDVERLSRGVVELRRRRVDVAEVVAAAVTEYGDPEATLALTPSVAAVDGPKLERIVVNLLANARRHAGAAARVTVRVRPAAARDAGAAAAVASSAAATRWGGVRLEVEDDGPGIPDAHKQRVFGLFEQGAAADTQPVAGTGIGLTLVAELTRLHGGEVWIEDVVTGGTRVVVWLPDPGADG
jgi:PAS domain S-box-containing protein